MPEQPRNSSHVSDPKLIAMLKEQMRTRDVEARRRIVFDIQRYAAEQQYYVYLYSVGVTGSWQPYVKNYAPAAPSTTATGPPRSGSIDERGTGWDAWRAI